MNLSTRIQKAMAKVLPLIDTQVGIAIRINGTPNRYAEQKNLSFNPPILFYAFLDSKTAESQIEGGNWMSSLESLAATTTLGELQRVGLVTTDIVPRYLFGEGDQISYNGSIFEIRDIHGDFPVDNHSTTVTIFGRRGDK